MFKLATAALLIAVSGIASANDWMTDVPKAMAKAKAEKKMVLLNFTGSDWCHWCIKLKGEIFDTKEFQDYASKNLVLVELDFPRKKQIAPDQLAANKELAKKYQIRGYPTLIILDSNGNQVGQLGYMEGGPKPFIAELAKLKK